MPLRSHENILVFYRRLPVYNPQKTQGEPYHRVHGGKPTTNYRNMGKTHTTESTSGLRFPVDILKYAREQGYHPTQKPVPLLEYLIKTYTNEGETVLDFTMGSGSTGVACINTNRDFIGIELDSNYFKVAESRIEEFKTGSRME